MPECQYCGRWFKSKKALRLHIIKTHTTIGLLGEKTFNPFSIDILGIARRREERVRRKIKKYYLIMER